MEIICPAWYPGVERLVEAIPLLADQGVTAVEICIDYPRFGIRYPDYFDHRDAFELQTLISTLHSSGVRVHSVHAPFGPNRDISSQYDEVHERGVDGLLESIELANLLDADRVIVHPSDTLADNGSNRRVERSRGVLREMAVICEESGIILAIENLPPGYLGHTTDEIFELMDGTDPGAVAVCFDCGHANLSGHFKEFADALLPRAVSIHMHDNDGTHDQHRFPGEGGIDWPQFAAAYRESGTDASVMLECAPPCNLTWSEAFQRFRTALGE